MIEFAPPDKKLTVGSAEGRREGTNASGGLFVRFFCWASLLLLSGMLAPCGALAAGWYPLFDGLTLQGWTTLDGKPVARGWRVEELAIHLDSSGQRGGEIITDRDYGDFDLVFEWKVAARGNSGIKYRVRSYDGQWLGCEYQMIDDAAFPSLRPVQLTGSLYDLYAPQQPYQLHSPGQFNRGRILVQGDHIEHWMNGRMVVCADVGSTSWNERLAASKFAEREGFGANRLGRIMLTDHNTDIWFRNLFIRPLSPPACTLTKCVSESLVDVCGSNGRAGSADASCDGQRFEAIRPQIRSIRHLRQVDSIRTW